jgi:diguanylate cyclase (GGDEF)-like protein
VLEKALAMASSDELTGLINRRGYYQRFESELERARRHQTPLCVALVDVDHFKSFNDTYGHLSGDLVLKALSELFTQNMRKSDVVCRFGGEEFAILLPDTSLKSAVELMERVRQNVEKLQLFGMNGEALKVTISIGLSEVNTRPKVSPYRSEISDSLALADEQLYRAKHQGRNQVCYQLPDSVSPTSQAG